jgi:ribosomal protein S17
MRIWMKWLVARVKSTKMEDALSIFIERSLKMMKFKAKKTVQKSKKIRKKNP